MAIPITQVDAFTSVPFAGNPAAVCVLSAPRDAVWMQNVAREMNLSETAFLDPRPDGYNLGMNLGRPAGAGVAGHLHLHFVPRWTGDSNFMTVTARTRLVPEELEVTFDKLEPLFRKIPESIFVRNE